MKAMTESHFDVKHIEVICFNVKQMADRYYNMEQISGL